MSTLQVPINTESLFQPLLTSREAAPFLRLHYKTLEAMARAGTVPATKKGKCWVFRLSKLNKWIDQSLNRVQCTKQSSSEILTQLYVEPRL